MTARLPFDPAKMAASSPPASSPARSADGAPITVSQLAAAIDSALKTGVPSPVRVVGEISGFTDRTHWYFSLKDAEAVVQCVMFMAAARRAGFTPASGQQVVATGQVEFYAKQGRATLIVSRLEPVGAGALELAFKALCQELRALGWFEPARKRPLPAFPRRIAVVTSRTGAALQDVLATMRKRCPAVDVALVDVRVQGDGAAAEVVAALGWLGRRHAALGIDAVLVTRGGGSIEDLWTFNERPVAEAILNCPIPVVAAIGHETDVTIAELVADERAATPTQAAMRLTPDCLALEEQVAAVAGRLGFVVDRKVRDGRQRLTAALRQPALADPRRSLARAGERLGALANHLRLAVAGRWGEEAGRVERLSARLERHGPVHARARRAAALAAIEVRLAGAMRRRLDLAEVEPIAGRLGRAAAWAIERGVTRLHGAGRQLEAIGPVAVLRRGYSATFREDGRLVRAAADVGPGDRIRTRLAEGEVESVVEGDRAPAGRETRHDPVAPPTPTEPQGPALKAPPRQARKTRPGEPGQMDLFIAGR